MSRKHVAPGAWVEWSPAHAEWTGPDHPVRGSSLLEIAPNLPSRQVLIAVSRRTAFIRAYRVPNAGREEIHRILSMQLGQLFPMPPSEMSFDFHLTGDTDADGRLAVVAAMRSADLRQLVDDARTAGLRITKIVPVALGSALLAAELGHPTTAVVHRTVEGLAIDLVSEGELRYSRVAAMPVDARGLEVEVGRTFAAAILPAASVVAAGGIQVAGALATEENAGAALLRHPLDMHLETPEQIHGRQQRQERGRLRLAMLSFAAASLLAIGVYLDRSDRQKEVDKVVATYGIELRRKRNVRDDELASNKSLNALKTALDRAFSPAQSISDVLQTVSNSAPNGVWLTGITLDRGKPVSVRGTAMTSEAVADYQTRMVTEPRLRDVKLVFANNAQIADTPVVQFSVSAFPVGNLPLIEPTKKGSSTRK